MVRVIIILFTISFLFSCLTEFEDYKSTNPLDENNPETRGKPFTINAYSKDNSIYLSWNKIDVSLLGYLLYRATMEDRSESATILHLLKKLDRKNKNEYVDSDIQDGTTYFYYVIAWKDSNIADSVAVENSLLIEIIAEVDSDSDSVRDIEDDDADNDEILNTDDNCETLENNDQLDVDEDDIGDFCDNCPIDSNSDQIDTDNDTYGDACDFSPETLITLNPNEKTNQKDVSFEFRCNRQECTFECKVDSESYKSCTSPYSYTNNKEIEHTFYVRAIDEAGNTEETPESASWTYDITVPVTTLNSYPDAYSNDSENIFTFSANEESTFECALDLEEFSLCTSPIVYSDLNEGTRTFYVLATDLAGNTEIASQSYAWTIFWYNYGWTKTFGSNVANMGEGGTSITIDVFDNIYVTGYFYGSVDFDFTSGVDNYTSNNELGNFVTKIDSDGSYVWTKTFNGYGQGITSDSLGNIYIIEGSGDSNTPYVYKINSDGSLAWARTSGVGGKAISIDNSDNIYVTGSFYGSVDFDFTSGTDFYNSNGSLDIFVTKINSDGTYGWTKTFGGSSYDQGISITTDNLNNIYVTGYFYSTVDFDFTSGTDNHTSNGHSNVFVTKINSNGSYDWTKTFGGYNIYGNSIATDSFDNIYITGKYFDTTDFDFTSGTDVYTPSGFYNGFLTKISANGLYIWTKTFGSNHYSEGKSVTLDNSDNIYITGDFLGEVDFDFTSGTDSHSSIGSNDNNDIFITKVNSDGTYGWTKTVGSVGYDVGNSLAIDSSDNILVTGSYSETLDFDFTTTRTDNHISNGFMDVFITKIEMNQE